MQPKLPFEYEINRYFDADTTKAVKDVMKRLGLPQPKPHEFLSGRTGLLVFLSHYGLVLRIEHNGDDLRFEHPHILQPIGGIEAGKAVFEICPGAHSTKSYDVLFSLTKYLDQTGHRYNDRTIFNNGILPVKTEDHPDGIPVIIDRLSVEKSGKEVKRIRASLMTSWAAQEKFYRPLRETFNKCISPHTGRPSRHKMIKFWNLCRVFKKAGKLVPGWEQAYSSCPHGFKMNLARQTAEQYNKRIVKCKRRLKSFRI